MRPRRDHLSPRYDNPSSRAHGSIQLSDARDQCGLGRPRKIHTEVLVPRQELDVLRRRRPRPRVYVGFEQRNEPVRAIGHQKLASKQVERCDSDNEWALESEGARGLEPPAGCEPAALPLITGDTAPLSTAQDPQCKLRQASLNN